MSEYIEDRISSLENRVSDIERHYNFLIARVNDLEDAVEDLADNRSKDYADQPTEDDETEDETRCDKCERLDKCIKDGNVIDVTQFWNVKRHYIPGAGANCPKDTEECKVFLKGLGVVFEPTDQSTEEFVRVVRCKDCKHHEHSEPGMVWCPIIEGSWIEENFFCAYGAKMDEVSE